MNMAKRTITPQKFKRLERGAVVHSTGIIMGTRPGCDGYIYKSQHRVGNNGSPVISPLHPQSLSSEREITELTVINCTSNALRDPLS